MIYDENFARVEPFPTLLRYVHVRNAATLTLNDEIDCGDKIMVDEQIFVREMREMERTLYRGSHGYLRECEDCADTMKE